MGSLAVTLLVAAIITAPERRILNNDLYIFG
jgi:hypothetical protein